MYAIIDASVNNIPTTYGTGAGSLLVDGAPSAGVASFYSSVVDFIAVTIVGRGTTVAPESDVTINTKQYLIPPAPSGGASTLTADGFPISAGDRIYIKTLKASASTSGKVAFTSW